MAELPVQLPTVPFMQVDRDGNITNQLSHQWARFFQSQWRKTGQASNHAPINSLNIDGILASLNLNNNGQLNSTNFCTVDSIDNGVDATIRVYGSGGVGTTWTRKVGGTTLGPYPALTQAGNTYDTDYYVLYNPVTSVFLVTSNFASITDDSFIWCGKPHTVQAGGAGGTSGGGGNTGDKGGVCFSGNTRIVTPYGTKHLYELPMICVVKTKRGFKQAKLVISAHSGNLHHIGNDEWATPKHPFWVDEAWKPASELFPETKEFYGNVYNVHVMTDNEEEKNFELANGHIVHNLSAGF